MSICNFCVFGIQYDKRHIKFSNAFTFLIFSVEVLCNCSLPLSQACPFILWSFDDVLVF